MPYIGISWDHALERWFGVGQGNVRGWGGTALGAEIAAEKERAEGPGVPNGIGVAAHRRDCACDLGLRQDP